MRKLGDRYLNSLPCPVFFSTLKVDSAMHEQGMDHWKKI